MKILTIAFILTIHTSPSFAQQQYQKPLDHKSWLGSLSFTAGSTARAGNQVMVCTKGGAWKKNNGRFISMLFRGKNLFYWCSKEYFKPQKF